MHLSHFFANVSEPYPIFFVNFGHIIIFINPFQFITMMEAKEKVLATMKEAGQPLNAGKIAELSGLDRKDVDKAMKQLKEEGAIVSPVRCKWAPAE